MKSSNMCLPTHYNIAAIEARYITNTEEDQSDKMLATQDYDYRAPRNVDTSLLLSCDYGDADIPDQYSYDDENDSSCTHRCASHYAASGRTQLVCILLPLTFFILSFAIGSGSSSPLATFFAICLCIFSILSARISSMESQARDSPQAMDSRERRRWQLLAVFFVSLSVIESMSVLCHRMDIWYYFQDSMDAALIIMMVFASVLMLGFWVGPRHSRYTGEDSKYIITL